MTTSHAAVFLLSYLASRPDSCRTLKVLGLRGTTGRKTPEVMA